MENLWKSFSSTEEKRQLNTFKKEQRFSERKWLQFVNPTQTNDWYTFDVNEKDDCKQDESHIDRIAGVT